MNRKLQVNMNRVRNSSLYHVNLIHFEREKTINSFKNHLRKLLKDHFVGLLYNLWVNIKFDFYYLYLFIIKTLSKQYIIFFRLLFLFDGIEASIHFSTLLQYLLVK